MIDRSSVLNSGIAPHKLLFKPLIGYDEQSFKENFED